MSWSIGFDEHWQRDVGYGVPALCDHPKCDKEIHRGLSYVCGGDMFGGDYGCGLHFCAEHLWMREPRGTDSLVQNCKRCLTYKAPYKPKADIAEWTDFKMTDPSWAKWRESQMVIAQTNPNGKAQ